MNGTIEGGTLQGSLTFDNSLSGTINAPNVIGQTDYEKLNNLPQIEGVTLTGNKSYEDLKLHALTNSELEALLTL